jgi:hypothetical protein
MHALGPDERVKTFLETHVKDKSIALFITHMAPKWYAREQGWIQKFKDAAVGANVVGVFDCQGQASRLVKTMMRISPNPQVRAWAQADSSQGQPDAAKLEQAKTFANEIVNRVKP